jgi:hypothetical protein
MQPIANSLPQFFDYLTHSPKTNQIMIIGYNVLKAEDISRNLKLDIGLDIYDSTQLKKYIDSNTQEQNPCFIFNVDFNWICVLSKRVIKKYPTINKINRIIFDSSTFKFLSNIKSIALLYYLCLEENGVIYIESSKSFFTSYVIKSYRDLTSVVTEEKNGFRYPNAYSILPTLEHYISADNKDYVQTQIVSQDQIYESNVNFIKKWFYGSKVELLDNLDESYPITHTRYPITRYYRITKSLPHSQILDFISERTEAYNIGLGLKTNNIVRLGSL